MGWEVLAEPLACSINGFCNFVVFVGRCAGPAGIDVVLGTACLLELPSTAALFESSSENINGFCNFFVFVGGCSGLVGILVDVVLGTACLLELPSPAALFDFPSGKTL